MSITGLRIKPHFQSTSRLCALDRCTGGHQSIIIKLFKKCKCLYCFLCVTEQRVEGQSVSDRLQSLWYTTKKGGSSKWTTRERRSEWSTMTYLLWGDPDNSGSPFYRTCKLIKVTNNRENFKNQKGSSAVRRRYPWREDNKSVNVAPLSMATIHWTDSKHLRSSTQVAEFFFLKICETTTPSAFFAKISLRTRLCTAFQQENNAVQNRKYCLYPIDGQQFCIYFCRKYWKIP